MINGAQPPKELFMDTTRQSKISRLIQKELSDILLRLQKETRGIMVSVSAVRVSPDLGIAKAYLSIFSCKFPLIVLVLRGMVARLV